MLASHNGLSTDGLDATLAPQQRLEATKEQDENRENSVIHWVDQNDFCIRSHH